MLQLKLGMLRHHPIACLGSRDLEFVNLNIHPFDCV